jgi:hypothetical protein
MTDFDKLLTHPEKSEIVSRLINGESPKDIATYLKLKYNGLDQKHLQLNQHMLKEFKDSKINLYEAIEKDVKDHKVGKFKNKEISESLINNKTYRERIAELADEKIDVEKSLERCVIMVEQRVEQIFDKTQMNPLSTKNDHILIKLQETLMRGLDTYDKIKNNRPDQVIQHNFTVQMLDQHVGMFQEAVREILMEMNPEDASRFIEKLSAKMEKIKAPMAEAPRSIRPPALPDISKLTKSVELIEAEFEKGDDES